MPKGVYPRIKKQISHRKGMSLEKEYGRKRAKEIKKKKSLAMKTWKDNPDNAEKIKETNRKIAEALMGHLVSEAARKKVSQARKGKYEGKKNPFYGRHHSKKTRKKISDANMGDKNFSWKGGRRKGSQGYIRVYSPDHPFRHNNKCILEHRLVMEQWLREHDPDHPALVEIDGVKYLRHGWVPHHKNEKRDDNRIENLELMTVSDHHSFHNKGRLSNRKGKTYEEIYGKKRAEEIKKRARRMVA